MEVHSLYIYVFFSFLVRRSDILWRIHHQPVGAGLQILGEPCIFGIKLAYFSEVLSLCLAHGLAVMQ